MSKTRFSEPPYRGQKGRCAWCGTYDLPKGRRTWCSQQCVDAYLIVSSPAHVRAALRKRDGGICAVCGCDADAEYRVWVERRRTVSRLTERLLTQYRFSLGWDGRKMAFRRDEPATPQERQAFRDYMYAKYCPGRWTPGRRSGWDADHVVPVVEGGGECGLDNYRTLCHPCHKDATAELAARRALRKRKEAKL